MNYAKVVEAVKGLNELELTDNVAIPKEEPEGNALKVFYEKFLKAGQKIDDDDQEKVPDYISDIYCDLVDEHDEKRGVWAVVAKEKEVVTKAIVEPKKGGSKKTALTKPEPKKAPLKAAVEPKKAKTAKIADTKTVQKKAPIKVDPKGKEVPKKEKPKSVQKKAPKEKVEKPKQPKKDSYAKKVFNIIVQNRDVDLAGIQKLAQNTGASERTIYVFFTYAHLVLKSLQEHGLVKK
jgi:hypothetical protein